MEKLSSVLVTDRTRQDVNRAKYLISLFDEDGIWRGTAEERKELEGSHGVYIFADLNRVLRACSWLAGRLERYGYSVPGEYFPAVLAYARAEPPGGGMVQSVLCYKGELAVVRAVSRELYRFKRWEENGETVSTAEEYSFTAIADRELTAVFGLIAEESGVVGVAVVGSAILGKDMA